MQHLVVIFDNFPIYCIGIELPLSVRSTIRIQFAKMETKNAS